VNEVGADLKIQALAIGATANSQLTPTASRAAPNADRSGDLRRPRGLERRPHQGRPDRPAARRRRRGGRGTSWSLARARRRPRAAALSQGTRSMDRGGATGWASLCGSRRARGTATRETNTASSVWSSRDAQEGRSTAVERGRRRGLLV